MYTTNTPSDPAHRRVVIRTSLLFALMFFLLPSLCFANAQLEKGIKHFKDFEIKQGLKVFKQLESNGADLSQTKKATLSLYIAMSYAYLRNKDKANEYFKKAIQQDSGIQLPKGTPNRLKKMFNRAKSSGSGSFGTPTARPAPTPRPAPAYRPAPTPRPAPVYRPRPRPITPPPAVDPDPPRRTAPPPRRRFSFGGFSVRKAAPRPRPRAAAPYVPPVRRTAPVVDPPPRRRRVAQADPMLGDPDAAIGSKTKPKSGSNGLWVGAWVTAGVAVAMAGVGFAMGAMASSQAGLATSPQTYQVDLPAIQGDAGRSALIANIMFIGAGAAAITSVILFIVAPKGNRVKKQSIDAVSQRPGTHSGSPKALSSTPAPTQTFQLLSNP